MKRIGNLYESIYDIDNLKLAYNNAKRHKTHYQEVKKMEENFEENLLKIQEMLKNKTFCTSQYTRFIKYEKKERIIYKLPFFPDRIVQWAILQVIEKYFIKNFILDTYSAIPGRGISLAKNRILLSLQDKENTQYCLKIDVKHYYQSIDHDILKQKYRKLFKDKDLLWILDEIVDSIDTATEEDLLYLYGDKKLDKHIGIPIGNYLSQYNANFYLSDFDHWIKETKKIKYYHRYMDDMVFLGKTKEELFKLLENIKEYLYEKDKLKLKNNFQIFPTYKRGLDFVGYLFYDNCYLIRKSTVKNMKKKVRKISSKKVEKWTYKDWAGLIAYKAILESGNSFYLSKKYIYPLMHNWEKYYYQNIFNKKEGQYAYFRFDLCNSKTR